MYSNDFYYFSVFRISNLFCLPFNLAIVFA